MFLVKIPALMGWAFTIVYASLWIIAVYFAAVSLPKALNSYGWEETKATVTKNQLIKSQRTNSRTHRQINVYTAQLSYYYTVGNQNYQGTTRKMAERATDGEEIHQKLLEQFPLGSDLVVYFNPANPQESVLRKGFTSLHLLLSVLLFGGIGWFTVLILNAAKN